MIWRVRNLKFGPNYDLEVNNLVALEGLVGHVVMVGFVTLVGLVGGSSGPGWFCGPLGLVVLVVF